MPSTLIRESRYDPESQTLSVWFVPSGQRYDYAGVPPETYSAFCAAFSKGRFFNRHIRSNFAFHPVAEISDTAGSKDVRKTPKHP